MSAPDYSDSNLVPTFVFGNQQDIITQLVNNLITESTDVSNSNFALANASTTQTITSVIQYDPNDGDADDNTSSNSNEKRIATRRWCKNAYVTNVLDPHIQDTAYTFTEDHIHSADLRVQNDPTLANSVTRRSWVESQDTAAVVTANNTIRGNNNTWTGTNAFNTSLPTSTVTPSSNTQLITKVFADSTYVKTTGTETIAGAKTFSTAPVLSGASITSATIPDGALASTFVKPSTAPVLTGTNFTGIPDGALSSTFVKTSGDETIAGIKTFSSAPVLSGASITSSTIPTSAINANLCTTDTTQTISAAKTFSANIKCNSICEDLNAVTTNSSNNYTVNYNTSSVAYLATAPSANFTLALHNSAASTTKTSVYTLIYANSNLCYPTTLNIYSDAGSTSISCTIVWLNGIPSISSATVSVLTISVMKALSSNYALCSLANYY
jgi:hypothetical protein